jgi:hypothetical protein
MTMDERVARLPKWVRDHIADLERQVQTAKRELTASVVDDIDSALTIRVRGYLSVPRGVPDDAILEWGRHSGSGMRVSFQDGVLRVNGDSPLVVAPRASNMVYVRNES